TGIVQTGFMSPSMNGNEILLHVNVPDSNANIWIENVQMSLMGFDRTFVSPPMQSGKTYTYTIRASWMENGREVSQEKKLDVQPGQEYTVTFEPGKGTGSSTGSSEPPATFPSPRQPNETIKQNDNVKQTGNLEARDNSHEGLIVSAGNGELVMTDLNGA